MRHFGRWPTFEDVELISLQFDRGSHMDIREREDWKHRTPPSLDASFHVFDAEVGADSPERRPARVGLAFRELQELEIEGLGYQNPMQGLGLRLERVARLSTDCLRVDWGGTALRHEVSLPCSEVAVVSVEPLPPGL